MTRFWNRLIPVLNKDKGKKLPQLVFDEYIKPTHEALYLKESMYGSCLVSTDILTKAYQVLIQNKRRNEWKYLDPFIQIWYSEFEKINHKTQMAIDYINQQLNELSRKLIPISSPIKNYNRKPSRKINEFISNYLKQDKPKSLLEQTQPDETDLNEFKQRYESLQTKISLEYEKDESDSEVKQSIRLIYSIEQNLILHEYYLYSQFNLLKPFIPPAYEPQPSLRQAILSRWQQKYQHHHQQSRQLSQRFHQALQETLPNAKDVTCAICLSLLKDPTSLSRCGHVFCRDCIQQVYCAACYRPGRARKQIQCGWLDQHEVCVSCPLCRERFEPEGCVLNLDLAKLISLYFQKQERPSLYSKVQRWSNKIVLADHPWLQRDPYPNVQMNYDMLIMSRKSWIM